LRETFWQLVHAILAGSFSSAVLPMLFYYDAMAVLCCAVFGYVDFTRDKRQSEGNQSEGNNRWPTKLSDGVKVLTD
jgi:hypothetical protein